MLWGLHAGNGLKLKAGQTWRGVWTQELLRSWFMNWALWKTWGAQSVECQNRFVWSTCVSVRRLQSHGNRNIPTSCQCRSGRWKQNISQWGGMLEWCIDDRVVTVWDEESSSLAFRMFSVCGSDSFFFRISRIAVLNTSASIYLVKVMALLKTQN